ncbi:MAG: DUF2520 domain-containing protein [Bacteroidales bacterium]|nr:DUF2520 domain-containing protein [Bacteroidales bacterium]
MKRTSISFVGSGNVATHLAQTFCNAGFRIGQVLSREYDHAQLLAARVDAIPIDKPSLLDTTADAVILAVADDALYDLALDLHLPHSLVLHTSGTTSMTVLKNISPRHGVLWSPQTFVRDVTMDYSRMPLCIEGCDTETTKDIEELAHTISDNVFLLNLEQRRWAHLCAVMVNNFVNAINATAQDIMQQHGLDFEMLHPLAEATFHKLNHDNLWAQQTGPACRRDEKTLTIQRKLLADDKQLLQLYDLITDIIQQR